MKTIKKSRFIAITSLFMGFVSLIGFCFGSWTFIQDKNVNAFQISNARPVAYISSDTSVKYTTVEKALDVAKSGETVYVIPGTNPTIKNNAIIKTGVTLCLPFDGDENTAHTDWTNRKQESGTKFADQTEEDVKTHRKSLVTLSRGVQLTNNGTLEIGGTVGASNNRIPTGQTFGNYAELLMQTNSHLLNKGTINLYGYIKEDSSNNGSIITHYDGASIKMPFVIYDFRGGTYSYAAYKENIMPFSNYDLPNCQPTQKFLHGSKINGMISLYAGNAYSVPDVVILGTENDSCLFKLSSGSVVLKYTPKNPLYTTNDVNSSVAFENCNFSYITVNGNISLSSLKLSLSIGLDILSVDIDSAVMDCPLDFKYQITVESGKLTIANKMKFLAGASLTINSGASLDIEANTMFHQNYVPNFVTGGSGLYPSGITSAKLINNGTLKINSAFGGLIDTSSMTGIIDTSGNGFSSNVTMLEGLESEGSVLWMPGIGIKNSDKHVEQSIAYVSYNEMTPKNIVLLKSKTYSSNSNNEKYFWSATVQIDAALLAEGNLSLKKGDVLTLTPQLLPDSSLFNLDTLKWNDVTMSTSAGAYAVKKQDWSYVNGTLNSFTFKCIKTPIGNLSDATWSYVVSYSMQDIDGNKITSNSITITIKH